MIQYNNQQNNGLMNGHSLKTMTPYNNQQEGYYPLQASVAACFFFNFFHNRIAGHQFNSRKSTLPPAATYCLRGGEYKNPFTPPCGILLRLSADTLFLLVDGDFVGNGLRYHVGNGLCYHMDKLWTLLLIAGGPSLLAAYFSWWHIFVGRIF
jgi:hypothetical protein